MMTAFDSSLGEKIARRLTKHIEVNRIPARGFTAPSTPSKKGQGVAKAKPNS